MKNIGGGSKFAGINLLVRQTTKSDKCLKFLSYINYKKVINIRGGRSKFAGMNPLFKPTTKK